MCVDSVLILHCYSMCMHDCLLLHNGIPFVGIPPQATATNTHSFLTIFLMLLERHGRFIT